MTFAVLAGIVLPSFLLGVFFGAKMARINEED